MFNSALGAVPDHISNKSNPHGVTASQVGAYTKNEVDQKISSIPTPDVSGQISTHNSSTSAHGDIRTAVSNAANAASTAQSTANAAQNAANSANSAASALARFQSGLGNEYVWDKCTPNFTYTQTAVKGFQNDSLVFTGSGSSARFRISNTLEEALLGIYTEQDVTPANRTSLNGKYVRTDAVQYSNQPYAYEYVFYIPPNATWGIYTKPNGYCFSNGYVYSNPVEAHTHHEYLNSSDPNAYPTLSGGYFYKALGQLGSSLGGAKIATGSYTGTGTYGSSNPTSLTFDFVPKFVYVQPKDNNAITLLYAYGCNFAPLMWDNDSYYVKVTREGTKISWVCAGNGNSAYEQCNHAGSDYSWVAIG